jgi:sugar lactone lactonase YvrE
MRIIYFQRFLAVAACAAIPHGGWAQAGPNPLNPATSKSVAVPRLTAAKRAALRNPEPGTMVFQTDSTAGFYYFTGAAWVSLPKQHPSVKRRPALGSSGWPNKVITLAGRLGAGHADGAAASFFNPHGVAVAADGTVYVADSYNHRIRAISPDGVVSVLAGGAKGFGDGSGLAARFNSPTGLAVDAAGTVYVADAGNDRIRKITSAGIVSTLAGDKQGFADGKGPGAAFHTPYAVALAPNGDVYVADAGNNRICRVDAAGTVVTLASGLSGLDRPTGIAVDAARTVYVADSNNNCIRVIAANGTMSTLAGGKSGFADGPVATARFNHPAGLAVGEAGMLYVSEPGNNRVRVISPTGEVSTLAGSGIAAFADGTGTAAAFSLPTGIAIDAAGTLYIADTGNNSIRKVVAP